MRQYDMHSPLTNSHTQRGRGLGARWNTTGCFNGPNVNYHDRLTSIFMRKMTFRHWILEAT